MSTAHTTMTTGCLDEPDEAISVIPPVPPPKDNARDRNTDTMLPIASSLGPDVPLSPLSPPILPSTAERARKYSPLIDLIESEKAYVEILTGIIRNVAAAWSRSNLPPPQLDLMFRGVEGVYKTNRTLLMRLKEIGENPTSPKTLGDLLMRWIDELEQPYTTYADRYCTGFDDWDPVKSNSKLSSVLQAFSSSNPPSSALFPTVRLLDPSLWTLDALFLLPKGRLQYYRKLYSRLLKSMTPGRSDHRLLTGALAKLDSLLVTIDENAAIVVGTPQSPQMSPIPHVNTGADSNPVIPMMSSLNEPMDSDTVLAGYFSSGSASVAPSARGSFSSRGERLSQETILTSNSAESHQTLTLSVLDLEKRISTEKTLDIFTLQPKHIRLQITPPTLPYARELRLSVNVLVRFNSKATGVEVIHRQGRIYILSDLFLLCEEMDRGECVTRGEDTRDMHLCYPPLSGKVLSVFEVPGREDTLQVSVMHKETLVLQTDSRLKRDRILSEFQECILFAKTISRATQGPTPPTSNLPQSLTTHSRTSDGSSRERPERALNPRLLSQSQPIIFRSKQSLPSTSLPQTVSEQSNAIPQMIRDPRCDVSSSPPNNSNSAGNAQQAPMSSHNTSPIYPPRGSSMGYDTNRPPSFVQIVPPVRSASIQSRSPATSDSEGVYLSPIVQSQVPQQSVLRHHSSMQSLGQQPLQGHSFSQYVPHRQNPQKPVAILYPKLETPTANGNSFPAHPPSTPITPRPVEQSSRRFQKSLSSRSLHAQYQSSQTSLTPVPSLPDGLPMSHGSRKDSVEPLNSPISRTLLPSMQIGSRADSISEPSILDPSPPTSPADECQPFRPVRSVIMAQMKCKVFHQQQHAQWKSLGSANLTLYRQEPTNVKQLVVETGGKEKSVLISTIVLTDGVERVGKTGVAIELSDAGGARTGIVYMIQLRNEESASGFFRTLLAGSDRAA